VAPFSAFWKNYGSNLVAYLLQNHESGFFIKCLMKFPVIFSSQLPRKKIYFLHKNKSELLRQLW
jgi:hypothetical protein